MILRLNGAGNFWYIDPMRLLFVADGRSPIAQNWMRYFSEGGHEVYLASTFECRPALPLQGLEITPAAFSAAWTARRSARTLGLRTALRHFLGPLTLPRAARRLRAFIEKVKPDLVHAMRIPYEGMLAAEAYTGTPLLVSVWGNDFTLHAPSSPLMRHYTHWTLQVAHALHTDCQRDLRLARDWGFEAKPWLVLPGNGGVRREIFHPPDSPVRQPLVFNPRGLRAYVRNDVFFRAIPLVLQARPATRFLCAAMAGEQQVAEWIRAWHLGSAVELLPSLSPLEMAASYRRAQLVVSPSLHDGTPNTLLEGMACGCLPIAGELESIREWIEDGRNGLLTDPTDPRRLAQAILRGLEDEDLRRRAADLNQKLIAERADYRRCMERAAAFYEDVAGA